MKTTVLGSRRKVMAKVANEYPGGKDCAAARLGITEKRLENQIYETAGVKPLTDSEIHVLEQETGTHHLPDYICALYGGVFMPLPVVEELDNVALHSRTVDVAAKRGRVDVLIAEALADGKITKAEAEVIRVAMGNYHAAHASELHATLALYGAEL